MQHVAYTDGGWITHFRRKSRT